MKTGTWNQKRVYRRVDTALLPAVALAAMLAVGPCSCMEHHTATRQIISETKTPKPIAQAIYQDGRTWYNDAQQRFIDHRASLSIEKQRQYNALLDDIGRALDLWGTTLSLGRYDAYEKAAFRKAKNKLIDTGFVLLNEQRP